MQISISIDTKAVTGALLRFTEQIEQEANQQSYLALDRSRKILKVYPPERFNQRYVRTGRLGRSWVITSNSTNGWTLSNDARQPKYTRQRYAKYVHGNAQGLAQAWMHVNRWKVARKVILKERAKAIRALGEFVRIIARRVGL